MKLVEKKYLVPFVAITALFALWGFANDITNPMVAAFQTLMELSAAKASLIQFAFYGGYATMAIPAALFIRKYSYKSGILLGLALYAIGALLFIPAASRQSFTFFCFSLYILTFGLAFLETTANPFILSLGDKENATRRLNLAQAFNPMGSLAGMAVASMVVLPNLLSDKRDAAGNIIFPMLSEAEKADIRLHDLAVIRDPYVALGIVVIIMMIIIALVKVPTTKNNILNTDHTDLTDKKEEKNPLNPYNPCSIKTTVERLWKNKVYREGVVAQIFYVAAQIMVWTFIIQYADNLGIDKATAQNYNIIAMCLFLCGRFLSTWLMKYVDGRRLLTVFGILAAFCSLGAILIIGKAGLYCLIGISFFMSLMFPTIYGTALEKVSLDDASLGAAFLVMAIVGGALMPPLQGMIIDCGTICGHPAVNVSYILPLICFVVVAIYGMRSRHFDRSEMKWNEVEKSSFCKSLF
ncbi:MAG: L-fucose:H+ symporter permease [Bacteroidales bacterium]|nr:L-fucose:H+ symporter permease [Bacteroidales bacterium]